MKTLRVISVGVLVSVCSLQSAVANVIGADTQNFNPTSTGIDFITVQSSQTLGPGRLAIGGFLDYAANVLPNYVDVITQTKSQTKDRILSSDFHMGLGLAKDWDFGFNIQSVLDQTVEVDVLKAVYKTKGVTDRRVYTKYRLVGDDRQGIAAIATVNFPYVENNPFYGNNAGPIMNLEFAFDTTVGSWALGADLGFRWRTPGTKVAGPIDPIGNQFIASTAAAYLIPHYHSSAIAEIYASLPTSGTASQTDRELSTYEAIVGYKYYGFRHLALYIGGGTELIHGTFTPDWRVFTGFNYYMGPLWGKKKAERPPVRDHDPIVLDPEPEPEPLPEPTPPAAATPTPTPTPPTQTVTTAQDASAFSVQPVRGVHKLVVQGVRFAVDSAVVVEPFASYLGKMATYLKRPPEFMTLKISGHTDSTGGDAYNLDLSRRRAESVKRMLVDKYGLPEDRITTYGRGLRQPFKDNATEDGRAQNRRVEFEIER